MKIKEFLFHNLGIRQTVLKNTLWLSLPEITTGLLGFALVVLAVRVLGVTEYGKFTFAFSFVSIVAIFSDLGIMNIATREFSRGKEGAKFSDFLFLDIILSFVFIVLIIPGSFFITSNAAMQRMMLVLAFFTLTSSFFGIFFSFFRGMQKMQYEGSVKVIQSLIFFFVAVFTLFYFRSAIGFAYGYLLSNLVFLILFIPFFHILFHPIIPSWNKSILKILKITWPLSLGFAGMWIYINLGSISLGYFNLIADNGWYGAASKMALTIMLPATLLVRSFYPLLSNFFVSSKEKLVRTWNYFLLSMIFFAVPMGIGGIVLAQKIIDLFYGSHFSPAVSIFQFLTIVMVITLIGYPYNVALIISDNQKKNFFIILFGIILHLTLNAILIPLYGMQGLIVSMITFTAVGFLLTVIVLKFFTKVPIPIFTMLLFKNIIKVCFSGLVMFFVITLPFVYGLNVFYIVAIGALVYAACLVMLYRKRVFLKVKSVLKSAT